MAVVGYEPVVSFRSDYNYTQTFWFHKFTKPPEPGTLCDRRVFNVGESLVTNTSIFEWKIVQITRPNAGKSGAAYSGTVIDCDVTQMNLYSDIRTWLMEIGAYSVCRGEDDLEVVAFTVISLLPTRRGPLLRNIHFPPPNPACANLTDMCVLCLAVLPILRPNAYTFKVLHGS